MTRPSASTISTASSIGGNLASNGATNRDHPPLGSAIRRHQTLPLRAHERSFARLEETEKRSAGRCLPLLGHVEAIIAGAGRGGRSIGASQRRPLRGSSRRDGQRPRKALRTAPAARTRRP